MDFHVADNPLFIDDEDGSLGYSFRPENIIFQGDLPMGPEIAQYRERYIDAASPCFETRKVVCKNTQNLGVMRLEEILELFVGSELARSDRCERCR
jgi:hypothetical protein